MRHRSITPAPPAPPAVHADADEDLSDASHGGDGMDDVNNGEHDEESSDQASDTESMSDGDSSSEDTDDEHDQDYAHATDNDQEDGEDEEYAPPEKHGRVRGGVTQGDAYLVAFSEQLEKTGRDSLANIELIQGHEIARTILDSGQYGPKRQCMKKGYMEKSDGLDTITAKGWCARLIDRD